ncbi:MAG: ATP-binding cassette domain-containing protein [Bacteroidetes bacterium]|nr:ATP-binding cassette domain-containing protein [Bacteroidota bacterium]
MNEFVSTAPAETIVELSNADIFQSSNLVLSNVNLKIDKGEFVYLIGKTGSGKSSLLKTIYGDVELEKGMATIAGFQLNHIKEKQIPYLRRKLGIVFQDFQLLTDRSVNANLHFVLQATGWKDKNKIKERIAEVLDMVGLATKGFKMPHELSGGEQQRVVIARALLNHPEMILADEPTGNLDPETSEGIMKLLIEISQKGCSVLMATHNYNLIEKFPARIIRCENGRLLDSKVVA